MTRILQPLDVSLNKPFKDLLREMYVQACIKAQKNIEKIKREVIIEWIKEAWCNKNSMNEEVIKKSFLVTGISNKEDGSEDDIFEDYQKLNEFIVEDDVDLNLEELEDISFSNNEEKIK